MVVLVIGVSLLREVQAGFHPPQYAAFLTQPSPISRHSSGDVPASTLYHYVDANGTLEAAGIALLGTDVIRERLETFH